MNDSWQYMLDFVFISLLIFVAAVLKSRLSFLRKWIVPTAMLAGFLGILLGPDLLGFLPFDYDRLGNLVYHLMGIGFIALSLKSREVTNSPGIVNSGLIIVSTYLIQGIVGLGLFIVLVALFYPDMFQGLGLLLPLGFGQGPGQAYSIGSSWEALGVKEGGNLGLAVAGIGFLWATIIGVVLMNVLSRRRSYQQRSYNEQDEEEQRSAAIAQHKETPLADAIDRLTYQVVLIGIVYLMTYLTLVAAERLLTPLGSFGETFAQLLIGFHFIIGSLYAMLVRSIITRLEKRGFRTEHTIDNYMMQRVSGFAFDYMITASIAAISIHALKEYAIPILLLTTLGGAVTIWYMLWIVPRAFPKEKLPNVLGFYGMLTGTISTGLALVKGVDPKFRSNTADNLVVGSASAILFGFPMLLVLNIPVIGYRENKPEMYVYTLLILIAYFALLFGALLLRTRKQANK